MSQKQHEAPVFQVVRQDESNAKFFVASGFNGPAPVTSINVKNTSAWF